MAATLHGRAALDLSLGGPRSSQPPLSWLSPASDHPSLLGRDVSVAGRLAARQSGVAPDGRSLLRGLCPILVWCLANGSPSTPIHALGMLGAPCEVIPTCRGGGTRPSALCLSALTLLAPPLTPPSLTPTPEGNPRGSSAIPESWHTLPNLEHKIPHDPGEFFWPQWGFPLD